MKISGSYTLSAPPDLVWNALFDPDTLKRAMPGCESVTRMTSDDYTTAYNAIAELHYALECRRRRGQGNL